MYSYIKRFFDLFFSFFILFLTLPITIIIFSFLLFNNLGIPFFAQTRPGKNCKLFKLIKFKTMNDKKDFSGQLLPDEIRLTKIGSLIRKTSLDEIPQLINVIKGEMSLIGPRPLLVEYIPLYNKKQLRRHEVKPGLTGWAQVNGRNSLSWEKKFELDVWYVDNIGFLIDIKIFILTIYNIFLAKGISMDGHATAVPFKGNLV